MVFRRLRRFVKSHPKRYPAAFRVYDSISWMLTRSAFGRTAKRFSLNISSVLLSMWISPRLRLARYLEEDGYIAEAIKIANDIRARIVPPTPESTDCSTRWRTRAQQCGARSRYAIARAFLSRYPDPFQTNAAKIYRDSRISISSTR